MNGGGQSQQESSRAVFSEPEEAESKKDIRQPDDTKSKGSSAMETIERKDFMRRKDQIEKMGLMEMDTG